MKRSFFSLILGAWALLAVSVPGCSHFISADEFNQSCKADADCIEVLVGDMCDCACTLGAINKGDLAAYREADSGRSCSKQCEPCDPKGTAFCNGGKCAIH